MRHPIRAASIVAALALPWRRVAGARQAHPRHAPSIASAAALARCPRRRSLPPRTCRRHDQRQTLAAVNADERRDPRRSPADDRYVVFGRCAQVDRAVADGNVSRGRGAPRARACSSSRASSVGRRAPARHDRAVGQRRLDRACELVGAARRLRREMNKEAQRLGMANTRFANATGLSVAALRERRRSRAPRRCADPRLPEYYPIYSQREFRYNNITQANRNRCSGRSLRRRVKTGHTSRRWCLIASSLRGERRLVSVVLVRRRRRRAAESQKLSTTASRPSTRRALQSGKTVTTLPVWKAAPRGEGRLPRRSPRDAAEGPGGEARAVARRAGAPDRADRERPARRPGQGLVRGQAGGGIPADRARGRAAGELLGGPGHVRLCSRSDRVAQRSDCQEIRCPMPKRSST